MDRSLGTNVTRVLTSPIIAYRASIGSLARLDQLAGVFVKLLEWAHRTGYPVLPMRSVYFLVLLKVAWSDDAFLFVKTKTIDLAK